MPLPLSEINEETAIQVAGLILWHEILTSGLIKEDGEEDEVDIEQCLDIWARCKEAGVKPPHAPVIHFVAGCVEESLTPDDEWSECVRTALKLISFLRIDRL